LWTHSLPLNFWILHSSGIFTRPGPPPVICVSIFMVGAAIYEQGARRHMTPPHPLIATDPRIRSPTLLLIDKVWPITEGGIRDLVPLDVPTGEMALALTPLLCRFFSTFILRRGLPFCVDYV
jgi:hypothetical protein